MIKALLSNKNMHVGKIVDAETMTKNVLQNAFLELAGGIIQKGGVLKAPYVLLCRQEMYVCLKREWEDLGSVSLVGVQEHVVPWFRTDSDGQVICAITDNADFPAHYIVLTDWEQLRSFLVDGVDPHSALLAIKGQSRGEHKQVVIHASLCVPEACIIDVIADHEFIDGTHNPVTSVIFHSEAAMLRMGGSLSNNCSKFLDYAKVLLRADYNVKEDVDVMFNNGLIVTLVLQRNAGRKKDVIANALVTGKFGT